MAEGGEIKAGISVVTLSEVYYKYLQRWPEVAVARMEQLRYSPYLRKIEVDEEVAVRAGELKVRYALPLADAIIASSAYLNGAIVISDDPEFKKVEEIRVLNEIEFCKSRA
jgi:ribonuclease VapC